MEEKIMIPKEEIKARKVEILKDINSQSESEKEIFDKQEQEKKERKFLIQLIVVFLTWVFLIILLMRSDSRIEENLSSVNVELTDEEFQNIEKELSKITIHGNRTDKDIIEGLGSLKQLEGNLKK